MRVWTETSELVAHFMKLTTRVNFETRQWQSLLTRLTKEVHGVLKATKVCIVKAMVFPAVLSWMWELGHQEGWVPKNWCFQIVVLENTLESPLDFKEIKPVDLKGNQPWIFIGRTHTESEVLILWPADVKSQLTGKDRRQKEKRAAEDEIVR